MPRNSSGIYSQPAGTAGVPNTTIQSTPYNNLVADLGNELTNSLPTTGVKAMGANLPMGGNRATGAADPTQPQDLATKNYVDTTTAPIAFGTRFVGGTSTGTASAQVLATTTPNTFALTAGNEVVFNPGFTPTGATTLQVGSTAAKNLLKPSPTGPVALVGGEFVASQETSVIYDGTQFILNLQSGNRLNPTVLIDSGTLALTGVISPAALPNGATNDYNPAGLSTASTIRITPDPTTSYLTGLAAQPGGTIIIITNLGTGNFLLIGQSASSLAANRFLITAPLRIFPGQSTALQYDSTSGGWQVLQAQLASPPTAARKNLKIVTTSVTAATITADELILAGPTTSSQIWLNGISVSYATGTSGANGLDTGVIAASTWYFEWVIYNPATLTTAALISLSSTAPTLPAGYTFKARVGASYFDAGSKLRFKVQYDRSAAIVIGTNPTVLPPVANGVQGTFSVTSPTLVSVSLASFVPTTASKVTLNCYMDWKGGSGSNVLIAPSMSYSGANNGPQGTAGQVFPLYLVNNAFNGTKIELVLEAQSIAVSMDTAGGVIAIAGWEDSL